MAGNEVRVRATLDDKISSGLDKIRSRLDTLGGKGTAGVAFGVVAAKGLELIGASAFKAGQAVGDFIGDAITNASNLNETLGKSSVVFGQNSTDIERWGKTMAVSFGLSENAAVGAAATFGNLFTNLGKSQGQAADMSKRLVELAGDLASFNNIDPSDALEKLRAGLSGEAEPLRTVGVFLTEAKVKTKAMELGLADAHGELSEGAKVMARYQLILDETSTAQGDFTRTSAGLANQQRITNAEMENMSAEIGQRFIPIAKAATGAQLNFLRGLNVLGDSLNDQVTPAVLSVAAAHMDFAHMVEAAHGTIKKFTPEALDAAQAMGILSAAEVTAEKDARGLIVRMTGIEEHAGKAADDMITFAHAAKITGDTTVEANRRMAESIRGFGAALDKNVKTVDDYYDTVILKDNLAATNAEIAAQKRIIASAKSTAAEKADARSALHQLQKDQSQMLRDLAAAGQTSSAAFTKGMASLLKRLETAHGAERRAILAEISALNMLAAKVALSGIFSGKNAIQTWGGGRAAGGPVMPGMSYRVGEDGPETLLMGAGGGGYVLPSNAGTGSSGGGGTTVHTTVMLDGRVLAQVVDQYQAGTLGRSAATLGRT